MAGFDVSDVTLGKEAAAGDPAASVTDAERSLVPLCALNEVPSDAFKIVDVDGREMGLVRRGGRVFAVRNRCPHMGAEICKGEISGTMMSTGRPGDYDYALEGDVVRCPWHRWEYQLQTGEQILEGEQGLRLTVYEAHVEDNKVYLARRPARRRSQKEAEVQHKDEHQDRADEQREG